ncbi:hypothetical protein EJ377_20700 [Chryseobacterium arthrosphaerae]|uniref:Uncharacterized protein n=1 Tax=Chryseobacterium arthrosphaerae TaxID=651561 RepID=A0A432DTZ2_9FLAO|nr:hypothetical protein EJ377_20700 [Chryseobacterium arthrosphaerae]
MGCYGWVNEYYDNGIMKREKICVYSIQNSIMFRTFDEDGKETDSGLLISLKPMNNIFQNTIF